MNSKLTRRSSITVLALTGTLAAVGAGYAAIPGIGGVIHGCYAGPSGQLRVVDSDAGAKCAKNEKALDFNQQGPKGDTGPQGPQGETGPEGPKGEPGVDGVAGLPETLPSGKTLKGAWSAQGRKDGENTSRMALAGISFAIPLASEWTHNPARGIGGPYNHNCPGVASDPKALPGHICVYVGHSINVPVGGVIVYEPLGGLEGPGEGGRFGAGARVFGDNDGFFAAFGTWAVTAR